MSEHSYARQRSRYSYQPPPTSPRVQPLGLRANGYGHSHAHAHSAVGDPSYPADSSRPPPRTPRGPVSPGMHSPLRDVANTTPSTGDYFDPVQAALAARHDASSALTGRSPAASVGSTPYHPPANLSLASLAALEQRSPQFPVHPSATGTGTPLRPGSPAMSNASVPAGASATATRSASFGLGIASNAPVRAASPMIPSGFVRPASPGYRPSNPASRIASPGPAPIRSTDSPALRAVSPPPPASVTQRPPPPANEAFIGGFAPPNTAHQPAHVSISPEQHVFVFGSQGPARFAQTLLTMLDQATGSSSPPPATNGFAIVNGHSHHGLSSSDPSAPNDAGPTPLSTHLSAFFHLAEETLREQIESLQDPQDLSVVPDISHFKNLKALCHYHISQGYTNALANGVLLIVLQVAQVLSDTVEWHQRDHHLHQKQRDRATAQGTNDELKLAPIFRPQTHFVGFCTGAITAAVLAAADNGIWSLIRQGLVALKVAFWVSLRSALAAVAYQHNLATQGEDAVAHVTPTAARGAPVIVGGPTPGSSSSGTHPAWSYTMTSISLEDAEKWINEFNNRMVSERLPSPFTLLLRLKTCTDS